MPTIRVKPIRKSRIPNYSELVQKAIDRETEKETKNVKRELLIPTATWSSRPEFTVKRTKTGFSVTTQDKRYKFTDEGTRAHTIKAKSGGSLAFNSVFRAKTVPNKLVARAGASRPPKVFTTQVRHPGTKARNFTREVRNRSFKRYPRNVQKAIAAAIRGAK